MEKKKEKNTTRWEGPTEINIKKEGGTIRGLGTDYVISGPMRPLKQSAPDGANCRILKRNTQTDMATL